MKIVISGMIGVGKSTISKKLYEKIKKENKEFDVFLENEIKDDNPYLYYYYNDDKNDWSFLIQLDFMLHRFKVAFKEKELNNNKKITIFDRHFLDEYFFTNSNFIKKNINSFQWNTYNEIFKETSKYILNKNKPDYFILIKSSFDEILRRIKKRNRENEKNVEIEYWKDIYNTYYKNENVINFLKKNTKKLIIVESEKNENEVLEEIYKKIFKI